VGRFPLEARIGGHDFKELVEAVLSWAFGIIIFASFLIAVDFLNALWVFLGSVALAIYILPVLRFRDPFHAPPWEMALLLSLPAMLYVSRGSKTFADLGDFWRDVTSIANSFGLATLGFLIMAELEMYSSLRTNRAFSGMFVFLFTMAVGGFSMVSVFISDHINYPELVTTAFCPSIGDNYDVMMFFLYTGIGGALMGIVYPLYVKTLSHRKKMFRGSGLIARRDEVPR
jgi:hypothetical protein